MDKINKSLNAVFHSIASVVTHTHTHIHTHKRPWLLEWHYEQRCLPNSLDQALLTISLLFSSNTHIHTPACACFHLQTYLMPSGFGLGLIQFDLTKLQERLLKALCQGLVCKNSTSSTLTHTHAQISRHALRYTHMHIHSRIVGFIR